jgi:hypothetical protein
MKEGYMTTGEALSFLGMHQHTFDRYVKKFGIKKEHEGRNTFYRKEDVDYLNNVLGNRVPTLIKMLEKITGGKVTITMPE